MESRPNIILFMDDFRALATQRLREASCLLDAGHASGAYYLAGYAVECALKAIIASRTKPHQFPPDKATIAKYYQHNLASLLDASELKSDMDREPSARAKENWQIVKEWNSESRYRTIDLKDARELVQAVSDLENGILTWVLKHL